MKVIYFIPHSETNKLACTVSDKSVEQLKEGGVIPHESVTLTRPWTANLKDTFPLDWAKMVHVDKLEFDDYTAPTKVEFDMELVRFYYIDVYKQIRSSRMRELDGLQLRALMQKRDDLVEEIEGIKQLFRDMPETVMADISPLNNILSIADAIPVIFKIDYEAKYNGKLSA